MKSLLSMILLALCVTSVFAQGPTDVPRGHWAYQAVNELIKDGLMIGYPDGSFLGNRNLTRYEFAVLIARVLTDLNTPRPAAATPDGATTPAPTIGATTTVPPSASKEDVANLARLVNEFKPELAVIGTRLDKVEADLAALGGTVETVRRDVSKLKKVTLSGYVQARYNNFQGPTDNPAGSTPNDNFSVRRARVKVTGRPTDKSEVVIQLDGGQNFTGSSGPSVTLKDAYVGYYFAGDAERGASVFMGQQKWPFGYEVVQSSSARECPERSLVAQRLFPGERDRGLAVWQPIIHRALLIRLGIFNGNRTDFGDANNYKDVVGSLRFARGDIEGGVSGYYGKGVVNTAGALYFGSRDPKSRWGADLQVYLNNLSIKGEYFRGRGIDGGSPAPATYNPLYTTTSVDGWWAQAAYALTSADELFARYDTLSQDPNSPTLGRRSAWCLGYMRWLDEKNRMKLVYNINQEEQNGFDNNVFITEWIVTF